MSVLVDPLKPSEKKYYTLSASVQQKILDCLKKASINFWNYFTEPSLQADKFFDITAPELYLRRGCDISVVPRKLADLELQCNVLGRAYIEMWVEFHIAVLDQAAASDADVVWDEIMGKMTPKPELTTIVNTDVFLPLDAKLEACYLRGTGVFAIRLAWTLSKDDYTVGVL